MCAALFSGSILYLDTRTALDSLEKHRGNNSPLFVSVQNLLLINKLHLQQKSKVKEGRSTSSELKISDDDLVNINEFLMCLLS